MAEPWSTERVAEQFRLEVRQAFERENAAYRAEDAAEIERLRTDPTFVDRLAQNPCCADAMTVRDSFFWEIYEGSNVRIASNSVRVVVPRQFAIYPDFVAMFDQTSVGWSRASVNAEIVDGEPRVVVELVLVDSWDDDRAAAADAKRVIPP